MMSNSRPNILLIMTDQLRSDALGCYGNPICRTPNLDRFAETGMRFDQAFTTCPVCSPSRTSIMTGVYPHNHKVLINTHIDTRTTRGLDPEMPTFSRALADLEYHLEYFGKWHVHEDHSPLDYGFHRHIPLLRDSNERYERIYIDFLNGRQLTSAKTRSQVSEEPSHQLTQSAISYLTDYSRNAEERDPFFLRIDFLKPHFANVVPEPFASMYQEADIPPWPNFGESFVNKPAGHLRKHQEWALQDKDWDWWRRVVAMYYADVSYVDHCCGLLFDALSQTGLERDTIVVFSADHADSLGSHKHFEKGGTMYDEVVRVPLIIRWPGVTPEGSTNPHFVRNMDLMPTFIRAAGGTPPEGIDAVDLTPLLHGRSDTEWTDSVYVEYHGDVWGPYTQRMVRTDDYKYVFNPYDLDELYDLRADPYEMTNRVSDPAYKEILNEMRARLLGWIKQTNDMFTYSFVTRNFPDPLFPNQKPS